jgi:hypothetical protein
MPKAPQQKPRPNSLPATRLRWKSWSNWWPALSPDNCRWRTAHRLPAGCRAAEVLPRPAEKVENQIQGAGRRGHQAMDAGVTGTTAPDLISSPGRRNWRSCRACAVRLGRRGRPSGPGRGHALCRARWRQAPAPLLVWRPRIGQRGRGAGRAYCDRPGRPACRVCRRVDPRLFAGARRHALHGQRRAAPWQAHGACAVGEARALLAGDALQALAFELLTPDGPCSVPPFRRGCAGCWRVRPACEGMAGGQAIDLASVGQALTEGPAARHAPAQDRRAAARQRDDGRGLREPAGTIHAATWQALSRYGAAIGLAFQVVDDILDVTADSAILGKTAGKDAAADKPTYVSVLGLERSRRLCQALYAQAMAALDASGLPRPSTRAACAGRHGVNRTSKGRTEHDQSTCLKPSTPPADLRRLPRAQLKALADELRAFVLDSVARTGGHLSSNLGTVELTVALHYVFNTPDDRLVWDVGHQTYPHKILTGRRDRMPTLRQLGGTQRLSRSAPRANTTPLARRTRPPASRRRWAWPWRAPARASTAGRGHHRRRRDDRRHGLRGAEQRRRGAIASCW